MTGNTMTRLLREYIRELLKEEDLTRNPETVGDLKALINIALSTKRADIGKEGAKSLAAGILADLFPGGGTAAGTIDVLSLIHI